MHLLDPKLSVLANLKSLTLFHCEILEEQKESLPQDALKEKKLEMLNLMSLNLSYNKLGQLAHYIIQPHFGLCSKMLESLYLVDSELDDKFAREFIKQVPLLISLRDIDLSHNNLESCFKEILNAMQNNCEYLSNLSLASCKFN
jgi:hypothetical protein